MFLLAGGTAQRLATISPDASALWSKDWDFAALVANAEEGILLNPIYR